MNSSLKFSPKPANDAPYKKMLIDLSKKAYENAYSPYSNFSVGAAILTEEGNVYTGCNVENISYPLGCCAEKNAICTAISSEGPRMQLKAVAISTNRQNVRVTPCGGCRQILAEFGLGAELYFQEEDNSYAVTTVSSILPRSFNFSTPKSSDIL